MKTKTSPFDTIRAFLLFLIFLLVHTAQAANTLFSNGKTIYHIVLSTTASTVEQHAATEMQQYLKQISGATFPILHSDAHQNGHNIYVGYTLQLKALANADKPAPDSQTLHILSRSGNLYIWGGSKSGTMYGIYTFLEKHLGVEWLSTDCTIVPQKQTFTLNDFNFSDQPAIAYRHPLYHSTQHNLAWSAHNKINGHFGLDRSSDYGDFGGMWGIHTMGLLIPQDTYFQKHPEYYSLHNGKRIKNGQLCLSNKEVIALLRYKLDSVITANPGYKIFSLSQNDNQNFCECQRCKAIEKKYGAHSGLILYAINKIAKDLRKLHPGVMVSTLAYQYSEKPPKGIKPETNVVIQLTDVGNCFIHPFTAADNKAFLQDLDGWLALTNNVYIWDYVNNFYHYLLPYPFQHAMQANYAHLAAKQVYGILAQGQYQTPGAGFDNMNTWLLAKMMWNPRQNVDSLAKIFIKGYYGPAADEAYAYYQLSIGLTGKSKHLRFYDDYNSSIFSEMFVKSALDLLNKGLKKTGKNEVYQDRLNLLLLQPLYLQVERQKAKAMANGNYTKLLRLLKRYDVNVGENTTTKQFLKREGYI